MTKKIKEIKVRTQELAMGRPLQDMVDRVKGCKDSVQEHLWKLFAYHKVRPNDVNGWIRSVNKYIPKLVIYNVQKNNPKRRNLDREQLLDQFVIELFEDGDIDMLITSWQSSGYPYVEMSERDRNRLRELATKFVDTIVNEQRQMVISPKDLL